MRVSLFTLALLLVGVALAIAMALPLPVDMAAQRSALAPSADAGRLG